MKKILNLFFLMAAGLLLSTLTASAAVSYYISNDTLYITGTGAMNNYSSGSAPWYNSRASIKALVIEDGVTSIGSYAFYGCTSITSPLVLPEGLTTIGSYAFYGCTSITSPLVLPEGLTTIGSCAFYNCTGIASPLDLPEGLTTISSYAFSSCSSIPSVTIPQNITTIGNAAFANCSGLTTVNYNATNCTSMPSSNGYYAFNGCSNFTTLNIGENVQTIPNYAFYNCSSITSPLDLPEGLRTIGSYAFYNCTGIASPLDLPEGLTTIGSYAFYNCYSIASPLDLPEGLGTIGSYAFYGCSSIPSVTIPQNITTIGNAAFANCSGLTTVNYNATNCTSMPSSNGYYAFNGCSSFTTLNIGEKVQSIPNYAFYNCTSITSPLVLPEGLRTIGSYAFANCSSIASPLVLPEGLTTISSYAFYGCSSIPSVTIPKNITTIGASAFANCSGLTTVNYNATNCTSMPSSNGYYAFNGCSGFTTLNIGEKVQTIPNYAFYNCSNITSPLVLPEGLTTISPYAFYNCSSIPSVTIPQNITTIGASAFAYCTGLTTVNYNATNCTSMPSSSGYYAFNGCSSFTTLNIGENVQTIPNYAFGSCSALTAVHNLRPAPQIINSYVFYNVPLNNVSLYVLKKSLSLYQNASYWNTFKNILPETRKVTFNPRNGREASTVNVTYLETLTAPAKPVYTEDRFFGGWYNDTILWNKQWIFAEDIVDRDTTLYARWGAEGDVRIVTFDYNNGTENVFDTLLVNNIIQPFANPARQGYTFGGWYKDDVLWDFATPVTENITLTAQWVENSISSVTTLPPSGITPTSAVLGGEILGTGTILQRGVVYSDENSIPSLTSDNVTTRIISGTGNLFSATVTGLTTNTSYFVRAWAINTTTAGRDTVHGDIKFLTTRNTTPYYTAERLDFAQKDPSMVDILVAVRDQNGKGANYLTNEDFEVWEDNEFTSSKETHAYIRKMDAMPFSIKTVLALDVTSSLLVDDMQAIEKLKSAAKQLISIKDAKQEFAILTFSKTNPEVLTDFTDNTELLLQYIDGINSEDVGNTTALYAAYMEGIRKLPASDKDLMSFMIVFTDGADQTSAYTIAECIAARGDKTVYTIGLGNLDATAVSQLTQLASPGCYMALDRIGNLEKNFVQIQSEMLREANSRYRLNYMSPKRGGTHDLKLRIRGNTNTGNNSYANATFDAARFESAQYGAYVNPYKNGTGMYGLDSVSLYGFNDGDTLEVRSYWSDAVPQYEWVSSNPEVVTVAWIDFDHAALHFTGDGTARITAKDISNYNYVHEGKNSTIAPQYASAFQRSFMVKGNGHSPVYVVAFHSDGGSAVPSQMVLDGGKAVPPADPVKDAFTFDGWYNGATRWDFNVVLTGNLQLTAHWTENSTQVYRVTFDAAGGAPVPAAQGVRSGKAQMPPVEPLKAGYNFEGWYHGDEKWDFNTLVTANITLTAQWTAKTLPELSTAIPAGITKDSVTLGGRMEFDGDPVYTERGVCYATTPNPTIAQTKEMFVDGNDNEFSLRIGGLSQNTTYYVRTYAIHAQGTVYGDERMFNTRSASEYYSITGYPPAVTALPSFVDVLVSVKDGNNKGADYLENENFIVTETTTPPTAAGESHRYVRKMDAIPFTMKTVLMLDNSSSLGYNGLEQLKAAAVELVRSKHEKQEIAVYTFSDNAVREQDFTADVAVLEERIHSITMGESSTGLYEAYKTGINYLPEEPRPSKEGLHKYFFVMISDGDETKQIYTTALENSAITARGTKTAYMIGLGQDLTTTTTQRLTRLASNTSNYYPAINLAAVKNVFLEIQNDVLREANSFYNLTHLSSKRETNGTVSLRLEVENNQNTATSRYYETSFTGKVNETGFDDSSAGIYLNAYQTVPGMAGVTSKFGLGLPATATAAQRRDTVTISSPLPDGFILQAVAYWADVTPKYVWTSSKPDVVSIEAIDFDRAVLQYIGDTEEDAIITVKDVANYNLVASGKGKGIVSTLYDMYQRSIRVRNIPPTGITLNQHDTTLVVGDSLQLTATVSPDNAYNQAVTWSSSDATIVEVSVTGMVTAYAEGEAFVKVTTLAGGYSDSCKITTERIAVTGVSLNKTSTIIETGSSETLIATVMPDNASDKTVTWRSDNPAIASVNNITGEITAESVGTVTITVTTQDGDKTATCTVTVRDIAVTGVSLNKTDTSLIVGETTQLIATVAPANAANKTVLWSSDNTSIATVSETGLVTAVATGTATITATTQDGGKTATCRVTVSAVTGVSLNKTDTTLIVGETTQLIATVSPANAANKTVMWSSGNTNIATVSETGLVTAVATGTATITVTTQDGGKTATCTVTVRDVVLSEDFENGANNWSIVNGSQTNKWYIGTATSYGGSKSAYISNNNGTSNAYNISNTSVVHLYCNVSLPASIANNYVLNFNWKGYGESGYDDLRVYLVETSVTPAAGSLLNGYTYHTYGLSSSWQQASFIIPASSTNKRLVFTWRNDNSAGSNPPAAIDNISITPVVATLSSLTVSSGTLSPAFSTLIKNYTVNVPNNVSSIALSATATQTGSTITGTGTKSLTTGDNPYNIVVTAQDGTTRSTYTVTVHRVVANASNDATLGSLTVSPGTLSPGFNANTASYTVNVANDVTSILVSATATHANAIVDGAGTKSLSIGNNTFNIVVTAENRTTAKTYTVAVNRAASNDATLSNLTVSSGTLSPAFNSYVTNYAVNVPNNVSSIALSATATQTGSAITGTGTKSLTTGNNPFNIVVTAQDGTTRSTYTVTVHRAVANASNDATLGSLTVSPGTLSPGFNANTASYTVNVANDVTSILVSATATHANAIVDGAGTKSLSIGNNTFNIVVTAENRTTAKTYTVAVNRAAANAPITFTGFALNQGNEVALFRTVDLHYTFSGGIPTHFMASEHADLNGAVWQPYTPAAATYTFASDEHGVKTVYTKLKNDFGETGVKSAAILYKPLHAKLSLTAFSLNNRAAHTTQREVTLNHTVENGVPAWYSVAGQRGQVGAEWLPYTPVPVYTLPGGAGLKEIFFAVANEADTSEVLSDQIYLDEATTVEAHGLTAKVFPNPVENELHFIVEDAPAFPLNVTVYTITGEVYFSQGFTTSSFSINLARCPAGVLLVKIAVENKYVIKRIIKL